MSILERTVLRASWGSPVLASFVFLALTAAPAAWAAEEVCAPGTTRISRLGTESSFSPGPVESWDQLTSFFGQESVQREVAELLAGTEWEELLEPMAKALSSREGWQDETWSVRWTEGVVLEAGAALEWMIFRGRISGRALRGSGPYCVATAEGYPAWGLEVSKTEGKACEPKTRTTWEFVIPEVCANLALVGKKQETVPFAAPAGAECSLQVERTCEAGAFEVDASGSSPGVRVTMNGQPVNLDSSLMGKIADPDPFRAAEFTATVEIADQCARPPRCAENLSVAAEKRPQCTLSVPDKVKACEGFPVGMAGHWESAEVVATNEEGETVGAVSGPFPAELSLCDPGTYTLTGTAATSCGTDTCSATVEVPRRGRWRFRGYPLFVLGDDASTQVRTTRVNPEDDLIERFDISTESGGGLGVSAEYLFGDRVGVEVGLTAAEIDTDFRVEQALLWGGQALYEESAVADEDIDLTAVTVGLNFHLTPDKPIDFYLGPLAGWAEIDGSFPLRFQPQDDLTQDRTLERSSNESFFGAQLGLDIPFGKKSRWAFHLGAMYIDLTSDGPGGEVEIGPVVAKGGLAFRD